MTNVECALFSFFCFMKFQVLWSQVSTMSFVDDRERDVCARAEWMKCLWVFLLYFYTIITHDCVLIPISFWMVWVFLFIMFHSVGIIGPCTIARHVRPIEGARKPQIKLAASRVRRRHSQLKFVFVFLVHFCLFSLFYETRYAWQYNVMCLCQQRLSSRLHIPFPSSLFKRELISNDLMHRDWPLRNRMIHGMAWWAFDSAQNIFEYKKCRLKEWHHGDQTMLWFSLLLPVQPYGHKLMHNISGNWSELLNGGVWFWTPSQQWDG